MEKRKKQLMKQEQLAQYIADYGHNGSQGTNASTNSLKRLYVRDE